MKANVKQQTNDVSKETRYSRDDLIAGAAVFGVRPEIVAGALRLAGREMMTRREAEEAIRRFLKREV